MSSWKSELWTFGIASLFRLLSRIVRSKFPVKGKCTRKSQDVEVSNLYTYEERTELLKRLREDGLVIDKDGTVPEAYSTP